MLYDKIECNIENFSNDLAETVRSFAPDFSYDANGESIFINAHKDQNMWECDIKYGKIEEKYSKLSNFIEEKHFKRYLKICLYDFLSGLAKRELPYGSLTGVRPVKLLRELMEEKNENAITSYYRVSEKKAMLMRAVAKAQEPFLKSDEREIDLFVNIPICKTRCSYCSFTCGVISALSKYVTEYVTCLAKEIEVSKEVIKRNGYRLKSMYIGGGTPTVLCESDFEKILSLMPKGNYEFTVEAGRPDSITDSKLKMMADYGVTRISINPQTFQDKTLEIIGRGHTAKEIYCAYESARKYPFLINMDLIAMLPRETSQEFEDSLSKTIALSPDNITVHSLCLKKGSRLKLEKFPQNETFQAAQSTDIAFDTLMEAGYFPYYLYRQKYMSGGENCGYAKEGSVCVYNIDNMEETTSVIACGAGGISKRVEGTKIERSADFKDIITYLKRFEELTENKKNFFKREL